jgi:hypothetical protein
MAKNYANIYTAGNVASALEQRFYIKEEATRGVLIPPTDTDFVYTLEGGSVDYTQPRFSSPHRTGRHHTNMIRQKKVCGWNIPMYFNIDESLGSPGAAMIDLAVRTLWKSLMGSEDVTAGPKYVPTTPASSFSIFECGDLVAKQVRGGFVQTNTLSFPGDGEANMAWAGDAKDCVYVGIGLTQTDNDGGNTVTLVSGDGGQFKKSAGGYAMLIEADGTTRSADTPNGAPRKITGVVGDVVTLDGAVLADADGSSADIYLVYYEPESPTAIDNPVTGLVGSFEVSGLPTPLCIRNFVATLGNEHEVINYCYGEDSLAGKLFVPGNRFTAAVTVEANLDKNIHKFFQDIQNFEAQVLGLILGAATGRHFDLDMPKVDFETPNIPTPATGSVPVSFSGLCQQTALDAGDEITAEYK